MSEPTGQSIRRVMSTKSCPLCHAPQPRARLVYGPLCRACVLWIEASMVALRRIRVAWN